MTRTAVSAVALLVIALAADPARAQDVRGTVTGAASGVAVAGAFVSLVDSSRNVVVSMLTNERGQFALRARVPGSYTLRVERLGLRTFQSHPFRLDEGGVTTQDLRIDEKPIALPSISARAERAGCRSFGELDDETAALWEEARKALAIAAWTADQPVRMRIVRALSERFAGSRRVQYTVEDSVARELRGPPWSSAPADELAREGFVRQRQDGYVYYGPDAHVLLSDVFLAGHCFRAVRHPDSAGIVGLEFRPRRTPQVTDIRGTLWLHGPSGELRWLDFEYVRLPYRIAQEKVGGSVRYRRLESGMWILGEWRIEAPRPLVSRASRQALLMTEQVARVVDVIDRDGRSLLGTETPAPAVAAGRPDDIPIPGGTMPARLWGAQRCNGLPGEGRMHVVGFIGDGMRGVGGARVLLITSMPGWYEDRNVLADELGLYRFCNVPAGQPYRLEVHARGYETTTVVASAPAEAGTIAGHNIVLDRR